MTSFRIVIVFIFFVLLSGCSNITMLRVEELRNVETKVDSVKIELTQLRAKMLAEQKKQGELLKLIRAEQQLRFDELSRRTETLAGSIFESQDRISSIDKKTQEIKKRWEEKAVSDSISEASTDSEIESLFRIAQSDFSSGRYKDAQSEFLDLINKYPNSEYSQESAYWIGECDYVQKNYRSAEKRFLNYIKMYPNGKKKCVSLFKLGLVYGGLKKKKAQEMVWNQLIQICPNSEESLAAKAKLNR